MYHRLRFYFLAVAFVVVAVYGHEEGIRSWYSLRGTDYLIDKTYVENYRDAEQECRLYGAIPAVINSTSVHRFIVNHIGVIPGLPFSFYLGLKRTAPNSTSFTWADGSLASAGATQWGIYEPKPPKEPGLDCVIMGLEFYADPIYLWRVVPCKETFGRILCQKPSFIPPLNPEPRVVLYTATTTAVFVVVLQVIFRLLLKIFVSKLAFFVKIFYFDKLRTAVLKPSELKKKLKKKKKKKKKHKLKNKIDTASIGVQTSKSEDSDSSESSDEDEARLTIENEIRKKTSKQDGSTNEETAGKKSSVFLVILIHFRTYNTLILTCCVALQFLNEIGKKDTESPKNKQGLQKSATPKNGENANLFNSQLIQDKRDKDNESVTIENETPKKSFLSSYVPSKQNQPATKTATDPSAEDDPKNPEMFNSSMLRAIKRPRENAENTDAEQDMDKPTSSNNEMHPNLFKSEFIQNKQNENDETVRMENETPRKSFLSFIPSKQNQPATKTTTNPSAEDDPENPEMFNSSMLRAIKRPGENAEKTDAEQDMDKPTSSNNDIHPNVFKSEFIQNKQNENNENVTMENETPKKNFLSSYVPSKQNDSRSTSPSQPDDETPSVSNFFLPITSTQKVEQNDEDEPKVETPRKSFTSEVHRNPAYAEITQEISDSDDDNANTNETPTKRFTSTLTSIQSDEPSPGSQLSEATMEIGKQESPVPQSDGIDETGGIVGPESKIVPSNTSSYTHDIRDPTTQQTNVNKEQNSSPDENISPYKFEKLVIEDVPRKKSFTSEVEVHRNPAYAEITQVFNYIIIIHTYIVEWGDYGF
ncbi:uncharacterized protein LOC101243165 [Ciona intestinalis]